MGKKIRKIIFVRKYLFFLAIIVLQNWLCFAEQLGSTYCYTSDHGLSSNSVTVLFQDSKGFLWIGTEDGLNRFDGHNFKHFRLNFEDDNSISGNHILAISEDREGNIWVGTRNYGLNMINADRGIQKRFQNIQNDDTTLPENDVFGILCDSKGYIWVMTTNFISKYDKDTHLFSNYRHFSYKGRTRPSYNHPIYEESNSTLLIGTNNGLYRFYREREQFRQLPEGLTNHFNGSVSGIIEFENGFLLTTDSGVQFINEDFKLSQVRFSSKTNDTQHFVSSIFKSKTGKIWVGTNRGIAFLDINEMKYSFIKDNYEENNPIVSEDITAIIEDHSGIIWLGTKHNGLYKVLPTQPKFKTILESDNKYNLSTYNFTSIFTKDDNEIWLGTEGAGVFLINIETEKVKNFVLNKENHQNNNDLVYTIIYDDFTLWIGSNSGVYNINTTTHVTTKFDKNFTDEIFEIIKDHNGIFWFASDSKLFRSGENEIKTFFQFDSGINSLFECPEQLLWIGNPSGLSYFDTSRTNLIVPDIDATFETLSLSDAGNGNIWLGTPSGLLKIDKDSAKPNIVSIEKFPNYMISTALSDTKGQIWIVSGKTISLIDNQNKLRDAINLFDGFQGYDFNRNAAFQSDSGYLYFGSRGGLFIINPDSIQYNRNIPKTAITNVEIILKDKIIPVFFNDYNQIKIRHQIGMTLNIHFSALEFTQHSKNRYQVFVKNYDKEWRDETTQNFVSLLNIKPGNYILYIRSSNNDQLWSDDIFEIQLKIIAPIWRTTYAYIFYFLIFVLFLQIIMSSRLKHYKNVNKNLILKSQEKTILEAQKEDLARTNRHLTDSINYATRIQSAVIPSEQKIRKLFPQSFVYFNPRDNVSGDFYWVSEVGNKVFLAAVDCTGHGVPGAFLSIIGMNLLRSIIEGQKEESPAKILEALNSELAKTLGNSDPEDTIRDGMDLAICAVDREKSILQFAGAVNELYMIRDRELVVFKGDRSPLGQSASGAMPKFTDNTIEIFENDMFFIFSDGYVDQFGGTELKKFKYRRFRFLLLNIHRLPPDEQKNALNQAFEEWKGTNEQVDDVMVMGFCPIRNDEF